MKDIELELRVRNNQLKGRRVAAGLSQREMADAAGVPFQAYRDLENLRRSPMKGGDFIDAAQALARYWDCDTWTLFPEALETIREPRAARYCDTDELGALVGQATTAYALPPADRSQLRSAVADALETLTSRERLVMERKFALGGQDHEWTWEEIAQAEGVSRERVRQIGEKALRKLRHPSRSRHLTDAAYGVDPLEPRLMARVAELGERQPKDPANLWCESCEAVTLHEFCEAPRP